MLPDLLQPGFIIVETMVIAGSIMIYKIISQFR